MKGPFDDSITLLASPWSPTFYDLVGQAQYNLLIASPFIGREPLNRIIDILASKQSASNVRRDVITNFSVDNMLSGALDVAALLRLAKTTNSTIAYLPSLHAKVYVADSQAAVVTSANLTHNGLVGNREYGVLLRDPTLVARVRADVQKYALLGSTVSMHSLTVLSR